MHCTVIPWHFFIADLNHGIFLSITQSFTMKKIGKRMYMYTYFYTQTYIPTLSGEKVLIVST